MKVRELFLSLIRSQICPNKLECGINENIDAETCEELRALSHKYDISAIIASALLKCPLSPETASVFSNAIMISAMRYRQMQYEIECITKVFEEEKIAYILLKGALIRDLYPEKWMRTSCDVDILVKENDLERAVERLCEKLSYTTKGQRAYHDISLFSKNGIHLELHFNICENQKNIDRVLARVWDYAIADPSYKYRYRLTSEFMIFHIISHASYHFSNGGCGVRPLIDLYLLENKLPYDENILHDFCVECSLEKFRLAMEKLSRVWLENESRDDIIERLEEYIFNGGLYGNKEIGIIVGKEQSGGKFKYLFKRIFMPYSLLSVKYPIVKKYPVLVPLYQVKRWFSVVLHGKTKKAKAEMNVIMNSDKDKNESVIALVNDLGLGSNK